MARAGILWRGRREGSSENRRLVPVFDALNAVGVAPERVLYFDDAVDEAREQIRRLDALLVWVDPITDGQDRSTLDALLRTAAAQGVWVSAHPDVVAKMGTKEVIFATRDVGWGTEDAHVYAGVEELAVGLPERLQSGARVLKQQRGNGGIGVWKVQRVSGDTAETSIVRVQHARGRDTTTEDLPLAEFVDRCAGYFSNGSCVVEQPFQPRIVEGMIRGYVVQNKVVGFSRQFGDPDQRPSEVFGLPSAKTMYEASEPSLASLRGRMETEWIPAMQRVLDIDDTSLPALWDADFLLGPKTASGVDTYVLCEINASCVTPFPQSAPERIADVVARRLT